jgi:hypothetical protein
MTPEQKRELREILRSVDTYFQRLTGADVPAQIGPASSLEDEDRDVWRGALRAVRLLDEIYDAHLRMRGSVERAVINLEDRQ